MQTSDYEAEQAVLGCIIIDPGTIDEAKAVLKPSDFATPLHVLIYAVMLEMDNTGQEIDEYRLGLALKSKPEMEGFGPQFGYLSELAMMRFDPTKVDGYVKAVKEPANKRLILSIVPKLESLTAENSIELLKGTLDAIESDSVGDVSSIAELIPEFIDSVEYSSKMFETHGDGYISGLRTGFKELDQVINGLNKAEMIILAARPAMGKTAMALSIAKHVSKSDTRVLIFSLEMSKKQLFMRLAAMQSGVSSDKLKKGTLNPEDWDRLQYAMDELGRLKIDIMDTSNLKISKLAAIAKSENKKSPLGLIIVDYLQLMSGESKFREQEIAEISRGLKNLSKDLDLPVLALSQLNRSVESRVKKRPQLSDLRESGAIEQDANIVAFIYRDEVYDENSKDKGIAEIIIAKSREGGTGKILLAFRSGTTEFKDLTNRIH